MQRIETWLEIPADSDFSIYNLPFGIFSDRLNPNPRIGVAIGDYILDIPLLTRMGLLNEWPFDQHVLDASILNPLMRLGRQAAQDLRKCLQHILQKDFPLQVSIQQQILVPQALATMHMPFTIGDYTDFYSSIEHAQNVGKMFRDPQNALLPNWRHLPVAYHGRASSIRLSGTSFLRPLGQIIDKQSSSHENPVPILSPTKALDFELEIATVIGASSKLGKAISVQEAEEYVFGFVLFNDWSARDIQRWEYQPLGPFLGKNFFSSISPWVVTIDALAYFRTTQPEQNPAVLPYLQTEGLPNFDINLSVYVQPQQSQGMEVCRTNFREMYWNIAQQIAHHTINGCNLNTGDLLASGTISGSEEGTYGSLLELSESGKKPIVFPDGTTRTFLEDFDKVIIKGWAEKDGFRVGFGKLENQVIQQPIKK